MKFEQFLESPISKYGILYFLKKAFESLSVNEQTFCWKCAFSRFSRINEHFFFENLKSSSRVLWISKHQNIEIYFSWKNAFESSSAHERADSWKWLFLILEPIMIIFPPKAYKSYCSFYDTVLWLFKPESNILSHF